MACKVKFLDFHPRIKSHQKCTFSNLQIVTQQGSNLCNSMYTNNSSRYLVAILKTNWLTTVFFYQVERLSLKTVIRALNRINKSRFRFYTAKPSKGATVLYTGDGLIALDGKVFGKKSVLKYHLRRTDEFMVDHFTMFEPSKSASLFLHHGAFFD